MEIALAITSILLTLAVFLSRVKNDFWIYRILEYPRLQKLMLIIIVLAVWIIYQPPKTIFYQVIFGALAVSLLYLVYKIWPYTVIAKKEMLDVHSSDKNRELKIFAANVLQENKQYDLLIAQVRATDPDLIFLLETDQAWAEATKVFQEQYPHSLLQPQENTYGLVFYSRFPLKNAGVKFLVKNDVPSINAIVCLPSGREVRITGLHPEPPVPGENLYATAKDKELMKVALAAKEEQLPCIVFGDLNDVAWSYTTELFRKVSGLLDPRRGRGFYSTFSAHHWYIRYPLDYIFCSPHFGLIKMTRMPKNGSDHFATLTHLALSEELQSEQEAPKADHKDVEEAKEKINEPVKG